jgi:hypothetical protein
MTVKATHLFTIDLQRNDFRCAVLAVAVAALLLGSVATTAAAAPGHGRPTKKRAVVYFLRATTGVLVFWVSQHFLHDLCRWFCTKEHGNYFNYG